MRRASWALALLLLVAGGCQPPEDDSSSARAPSDGPRHYRLAVIPKGTTHVFWKSVHAGADQAARELGNVDIIWKGPMLENDREGQIKVVQDFISSRVDGIVLAPLDSRALVASVKYARERGIPTVIFDSGLDDESIIVSYVATDNFQGGALAARQLAAALGGQGDVILLRYTVGSESTHQREEGFLATLKDEFPDINVVSSNQYAETTTRQALEKAQQVLPLYRDTLGGIFAVCEPNGEGILRALEDLDLAGKVKFVAFDPSPRLIEAMRAGKVHGIVLQDPVHMGYLAVKTMVEHLEGREVDSRVSTGEYVATPENMDTPEMQRLLNPKQFGD